MKELIKTAAGIFHKNWKSILIFEIVYRTGMLLAIFPVFITIFIKLQQRMGYSYLTPDNTLHFMSHPWTIMFLAAGLLLACFLTLIEINALLIAYQFSYSRKKISAIEMIVLGCDKAIMLLKSHWILSFLWVFFLLPVVNAHMIVRFCMDIPLLSYLIMALYQEIDNLYFIGTVTGGILLCGIIGISTTAYSYFLLEKNSDLKKRAKKAINLIKKLIWPNSFLFIVGNTLVSVLLQSISYIIVFFIAVLIRFFTNPDTAWVRTLLYENKIAYITVIAAGIVSMIGNMALVSAIYLKQGWKQESKNRLMGMKIPQCGITLKTKQIGTFCLVLLLSLEGIAVITYTRDGSLWVEDVMSPIAITAHRGSAVDAPENTIVALETAIDQLADYAEIDVQESADGVLFLLHDSSLKRTTGWNEYGYAASFEQIKQLDAGSYFHKDFIHVCIPSLEEVLQLCKGKIKLNIELKANSKFEQLPQKAVSLIEKYNFENQCVITSTSLDYLRQVKKENPRIKTGYIMQLATGCIEETDYDFFSIQYQNVTKEFVEKAHQQGKEVHVWTVDSYKAIEQMKALKVNNIITDDPVKVRTVLTKRVTDNSFLEWMAAFFK